MTNEELCKKLKAYFTDGHFYFRDMGPWSLYLDGEINLLHLAKTINELTQEENAAAQGKLDRIDKGFDKYIEVLRKNKLTIETKKEMTIHTFYAEAAMIARGEQ